MSETQQLYAEDFTTGQTFSGEPTTLTAQLFQNFAGLTGDAHPIHYDADYASRSVFGRPVAHGLLLSALTALGATQMSAALNDSMIALVHQSFDYLKPAFPGDTVKAVFTCESVTPSRKPGASSVIFGVQLVNQDNVTLIQGRHGYLLRSRTAVSDHPTP